MAMGLMELNLLMLLLVGNHPIMLPAHLAATAAVGAQAATGAYEQAEKPTGDTVVIASLDDAKGLEANGRVLACRVDGTWKPGPTCDARLLQGQEMRVFTGSGGVVGRWKIHAGHPSGDPLSPQLEVAGTLTAPLPKWDGEKALDQPFAILGDARHVVEPPETTGYDLDEQKALLELGKRTVRMNRRMSERMEPAQYAVFDLTPQHRDVIALAGSSWPDGKFEDVPRPSASMLFVADPDATPPDWARYVTVQVISRPDDARMFERYRLGAVLDIDGDRDRELLVRARSAKGDRYALFTLSDDDRHIRPLTGWAGVRQPAQAPTSPHKDPIR